MYEEMVKFDSWARLFMLDFGGCKSWFNTKTNPFLDASVQYNSMASNFKTEIHKAKGCCILNHTWFFHAYLLTD